MRSNRAEVSRPVIFAMDDSNKLSIGTTLLLALTVVLGAVGDLLLGAGMKEVGRVEPGSASALTRAFVRTFTNTDIWMGVASLLVFFICYLVLLSRVDYSYVQPASAVGYALVALLGYAVLGEAVTVWRWAGIGCICLGVGLVGQTPPRTTV
jgi:multidrug transporter EmrE-like cation transporter